MPFSESYEQRQILERATARLNQLAPDNITTNNARRFDEPPPPYTSEETTRSPSPTHDNISQPDMQAPISAVATPFTMFDIQARCQIDRLQEQNSLKMDGRTQTFPFDKSSDLRANAENNVRSMWLEQDIWRDDWGGAWPSNSFAMDNMWRWSRAKSPSRPRPHGRWKHEQVKSPNRSDAGDLHASVTFSHVAATAKSLTEVTTYTGSDTANTDASRPDRQFAYQVDTEMRWLRDSYKYKSQLPNEIDQVAYNGVKQSWLQEGIWDPLWGQSPRIMWAHEVTHLEPRMRFNVQQNVLFVSDARAAGSTPTIGEDTEQGEDTERRRIWNAVEPRRSRRLYEQRQERKNDAREKGSRANARASALNKRAR